MQQDITKKSYQELSDKEFQLLLSVLDAMFQDNYSDKNSKGYKKAKLTFDKLKNSKCKVCEFEATLKEFSNRHTFNFWMPAHIYQIWKEEYGPIGMVM